MKDKLTSLYPAKICPEYGNSKMLNGPSGGMSQNVYCPKCGKEWNYTPFGFKPIIPTRSYLYRQIETEFPVIVPISCPPGCEGKNDLCIAEIQKTVQEGNVAFMIYTQHVRDKIEPMGYQIEIKKLNNIPVGMYISGKGEPSVYDKF